DRIYVLGIATLEQVKQLETLALRINDYLQGFFAQCQITLVDFKLEFGLDSSGTLRLADEISPDTCRLWDQNQTDTTARVLDKDRFRRDLGQIEEAYREVQQRVLDQIAKIAP
ncbi:MAG: hypothetical protein RLZZ148_1940, partial [Cyanobacteriota bacterium]